VLGWSAEEGVSDRPANEVYAALELGVFGVFGKFPQGGVVEEFLKGWGDHRLKF
jgi:hypothetical protein